MTQPKGYRTIDNRKWAKPQNMSQLPIRDIETALAVSADPNDTLDDTLEAYEAPKDVEEKPYNLQPMQGVWGEFKLNHASNAETGTWLKQFKALLPKVPGAQDATILTLNDDVVATYRYDGVLSETRVQERYPDLYAKFIERKSVLVFNKEAFAAAYPAEYTLCRGRSLRLKKSAGGIVLPHN